jgi:hypothetical protein
MTSVELNMMLNAAIQRRHTSWDGKPEGLLIFELRTGTGYKAGEPNRLDAFFMAETLTQGLRRIVYEIKTSRADFLRELREPRKRRAALRVSNQFYFVTIPGLVKAEEVPLECGLLELRGNMLDEVVAAPYRDSMPASWLFFAAVARRLMAAAPGPQVPVS